MAVAVLLVFLACSVCAQDLRQQEECEVLFSAAVRAEQQNNPIEAEFRYEECRELAQKYLLPKMEAATLHRLAVIKAQNKKFSESANLFRRAHDLDPQNALVLCDFAQLHADRKDYDEAEKLLKKALGTEPNNPTILFNLGSIIASQRAERQTEGLRYLKLAVGEAEAYRELARIYRSKGDISRAEFADQKAELAENQKPANVFASAPSGNNVAVIRSTELLKTPPEVVERVRQELLETKMREAIGIQQHPVTPTIPPPETAVLPAGSPPDSSKPPIDPFITLDSPQASTAAPVRILESPSVTAYTPTVVRTIPGPSESSCPAPSSNPMNASDSFAPVQMAKNSPTDGDPADSNATADKPVGNDSPQPQRSVIHSSDTVIANSPQPSRSPATDVPHLQANDTSFRVLPSGAKHAKGAGTGNPLRQIPPSDSAAPANDGPFLAPLSSSSAGVTRKIPRTDQSTIQEQEASSPQKAELPLSSRPGGKTSDKTASTTETTEVTRTIRHLPVRDNRAVQVPATVLTRVESPPENPSISPPISAPAPKNDGPYVAHAASEPLEPAMPLKTSQSNRQFAATSAPNVIGFGPNVRNQSAPVSSNEFAEAAVKPLARNDSPQVAGGDPFPITAEKPPFTDVHEMPAVATKPTDPFPMAEESPSMQFAEVKKIEPRTQQTPMPVQPESKPVIADQPPQFAVTKKTESLPRLAPLPMEAPKVATKDIPPLFSMKDEPAGFASSRSSAPKIAIADDSPAGFAKSKK